MLCVLRGSRRSDNSNENSDNAIFTTPRSSRIIDENKYGTVAKKKIIRKTAYDHSSQQTHSPSTSSPHSSPSTETNVNNNGNEEEPSNANGVFAGRAKRESNFLVQIRVRPPVQREIEGGMPYQPVLRASGDKEILLHENLAAYDSGQDDPQQFRSHGFTFDRVYGQVCLPL